MRIHQIPVLFNQKLYLFGKFSGSLFESDKKSMTTNRRCAWKDDSWMCVEDPYRLKKRENVEDAVHVSWLMTNYAKLLVYLCSRCFFAAYMLSKVNVIKMADAGKANKAFRSIIKENQNTLCLPRALFISSVSRRFKRHGAMYIGCFFPTKSMHAWVIEDGMLADEYDKYWIMYNPVAVMK